MYWNMVNFRMLFETLESKSLGRLKVCECLKDTRLIEVGLVRSWLVAR